MLQPAAITALLSQLINENNADSSSIRPHTALLTLLDSSELYAVATRLVDSPPSKSAVASILASTAAAAGTAPPVHYPNGRPLPLTLDERAACLSAIAVTSWRQATEGAAKKGQKKPGNVVMPGSSVSVAKHAVTGMTSASGKKAYSKEMVPLLLQSDLGRILVMPIVPSAPTLSPSRSELAAMDESNDDASHFSDHSRPFMLLTLNAPSDGPPANLPKSPSTPNATLSPALASSTATLSATNPARSRLRSGGTTPTSTRSDNTATPSRSPVSDHFPISSSGGPQGSSSSPLPGSSDADAVAWQTSSAEQDAWEAKLWSGLYAQAKALARVLAPSLTKCGVGQHHIDEHHGGETGHQSGAVSDDEVES
ncbi:uncharacterized protein UTRI_04797 [Ustilago trichophora]|uniref:Uncharacterized protein n=1 Tax=Ustilago trichophora TaxID=86804 RepID=A0A5C3EDW4_9BASI|nr:uncharacterized protein UTRI_04797 [Ustilago trichophora]